MQFFVVPADPFFILDVGATMKFYRAADFDGLIHWLTDQSEAKYVDKEFTEHEIGNQKTDLKILLNECETQLHELRGRINVLKFDATIPPITIPSEVSDTKPSPVVQQSAQSLNATSIVEWVIDTATQSQVEQIFTALGVRFGESRHACE